MVVEDKLPVANTFVVCPEMILLPTVEPVPHSYVPKPAVAVSVVDVPEQIEVVPVIAVGVTANGVTVTVIVIPELSTHGEVPFTRTQ